MNLRTQLKKLFVVTATGVMISITAAAHAEYEPTAPVIITDPADATGQPVGESTNAVGSVAYPTYYLSAPGNGNVSGYGYADEDIMRYQSGSGTWNKAFDGTNAGLPASADIDALTVTNAGPLVFYMSFDNPTAVPGLGTIDDSDVAAYNTVSGTWSLYFDGSAYGLTTDAEDIDALSFRSGLLVLSTAGNVSVNNFPSGTLKAKDEDLILLVDGTKFTLYLDGTTIGLSSTNDLRGASTLPMSDSFTDSARYVSAQASFVLPNGTAIGTNDISEQMWFKSGYMDYYKKLDASDAGFPKIDAFEVVQ